jgi:outer membrane protein
MLLKKKLKALVILLISGFLSATAQESFNLTDLINMTLQENYQLKIMRNQKQMADNLNTIGNAGMLPSIGISSDRTWDIQTSEANLYTGVTRIGDNALSTGFNAMLAVDWTVFDGFSMFARRDRLGYLASLSELEMKYFLEQTIADLTIAYNLLIRERQLLESYRQSKEVSAFRLELERRKLDIGSGNALLYQQALVDYNHDSILVIDQQMNIREQEIQINRIINRNPRLPFEPGNDQIDLNGVDPMEELVEMSITNNRELERTRLIEMLAEANTRIERGDRYPQISLWSAYSYSRQTSETGLIESAQSRGPRFGVRVRFNLYDGGRQTANIRNALLEQESATIDIDDTNSYIESNIVRLSTRYDSFVQQYRILLNSVEAAERSLMIASEQLQSGAINGYEFRQTQLASLQVKNQMITLMYAMKVIETDIDRISGTLIERVL